ncbi:hypothetical protein R1flu_028787 [Riccia fluitans]|uniref:Uncharacterized protein n=1 Tax=Riccia fluitans TaxID=41844 RepID=A0ABD1XN79_9MARC
MEAGRRSAPEARHCPELAFASVNPAVGVLQQFGRPDGRRGGVMCLGRGGSQVTHRSAGGCSQHFSFRTGPGPGFTPVSLRFSNLFSALE